MSNDDEELDVSAECNSIPVTNGGPEFCSCSYPRPSSDGDMSAADVVIQYVTMGKILKLTLA